MSPIRTETAPRPGTWSCPTDAPRTGLTTRFTETSARRTERAGSGPIWALSARFWQLGDVTAARRPVVSRSIRAQPFGSGFQSTPASCARKVAGSKFDHRRESCARSGAERDCEGTRPDAGPDGSGLGAA